MPGSLTPIQPAAELAARLADLERRLAGLERNQYHVFVDPTGTVGDPAHGHAVIVLGNLQPITGLTTFGAASFKTGAWVQL